MYVCLYIIVYMLQNMYVMNMHVCMKRNTMHAMSCQVINMYSLDNAT